MCPTFLIHSTCNRLFLFLNIWFFNNLTVREREKSVEKQHGGFGSETSLQFWYCHLRNFVCFSFSLHDGVCPIFQLIFIQILHNAIVKLKLFQLFHFCYFVAYMQQYCNTSCHSIKQANSICNETLIVI